MIVTNSSLTRLKEKKHHVRYFYIILILIVLAAVFCIFEAIISEKNSEALLRAGSSVAASQTSSDNGTSITQPSSSTATTSSVAAASSSSLPQASQSGFEYFNDAVFMGDSVTVDLINYDEMEKATVVGSIGVSAYKALTDHKVAVNGNKSDLAWMPDRAAAAAPKKIYMMFGTNDLCWGSQMTVGFFIQNYSKLIDVLQSRCTGAKIYVQSILPITASAENKKNWPFDNAKIDKFNAALQEMCGKKGIKYLNVASQLKGTDGKLPSSASDDGLHLKSKEYKTWFNYLLANE